MKYTIGVLICTLSIFFSSSCKEDCFVDCISVQPAIFMKVISSADPTDLLFGENSFYDIDDIIIFSLKVIDSTITNLTPSDSILWPESNFYTLPVAESGTVQDSFLIFTGLDINSDRLYMNFGNSEVDTLNINFQTTEDECCGTASRVNIINHNNTPLFSLANDNFYTVINK